MRYAGRPRTPSYVDIHRAGQYVERFDIHGDDFAVNHHIHGSVERKLHLLDAAGFGQRVLGVRAVIQARQHFQQAEPADGAPANKFDKAVGRVGGWCDHHGAAGVFAVVEGEEEAAALVPQGFGVGAKLEGATLELQDAHEDAKKITEMAESLEAAVGERADVRGEANAEQVEGIDGAAGVAKAEDIHAPLAAGEESVDGRFGALFGVIAQKRNARAHGKQAKFDAIGCPFTRENAVDDLVWGAAAAA